MSPNCVPSAAPAADAAGKCTPPSILDSRHSRANCVQLEKWIWMSWTGVMPGSVSEEPLAAKYVMSMASVPT